MNVRNLKHKSATDWARIDKMTDEEIDTSDIPPLDDAFFAAAKWLLPRLYIDANDFREALQFAGFILRQRLHEKKKTELARAKQQVIHRAFNTSLIVAYARPFKSSNDLKGKRESPIKDYKDVLRGETETELHLKVLSMRDQLCAHSDARSHLFEGMDYTKVVFMKWIEPLNKAETRILKNMIKKWIEYVEVKKSNLKESSCRLSTSSFKVVNR
jgi:hypothetical protein